MEETFVDSPLYGELLQIDTFGRLPVESTVLMFRHRLDKHEQVDQIPAIVNEPLQHRRLLLKAGTAVDATLIAAPSSTKNRDKAGVPEIRLSPKGNEWHFDMKAYIGINAHSGLEQSARGTSGNVADVTEGNWPNVSSASRRCGLGV